MIIKDEVMSPILISHLKSISQPFLINWVQGEIAGNRKIDISAN